MLSLFHMNGRPSKTLGPRSGSSSVATVSYMYDPRTGAFSPTGSITMTAFRSNATATMLPDGRVLIAGGMGVIAGTLDGTTLASAEMYGP